MKQFNKTRLVKTSKKEAEYDVYFRFTKLRFCFLQFY